jgi:hypothetical protein
MSATSGESPDSDKYAKFLEFVARGAASYDAPSLPENRRGRLTADQRRNLGRESARTIKGLRIVIALGLAIAAGAFAVAFIVPGSSIPALIAGTTAVLFPIASVVFLQRGRSMRSDVEHGSVRVVEGPISKRSIMLEGGSVEYLVVSDKRYRSSADIFNRAPESGRVRLFVLPRSGRVVNFEAMVGDDHDGP